MNKIKGSVWAKVIGWVVWSISLLGLITGAVGTLFLDEFHILSSSVKSERERLYMELNEGYSFGVLKMLEETTPQYIERYFAEKEITFQYGVFSGDAKNPDDYSDLSNYEYTNMQEGLTGQNYCVVTVPKQSNVVYEEWYDRVFGFNRPYGYHISDQEEIASYYCDKICYDDATGVFYYHTVVRSTVSTQQQALYFPARDVQINCQQEEGEDMFFFLTYQEDTKTYLVSDESGSSFGESPVDHILLMGERNQLIFDGVRWMDWEEIEHISSVNLPGSAFPDSDISYLDGNYTLHAGTQPEDTGEDVTIVSVVSPGVFSYSGRSEMLKTVTDSNVRNPYHKIDALLMLLDTTKYQILATMGISFVTLVISCVFLICAAGWRKDKEEIVMTPFDRIPLELYVACIFGLYIGPVYILGVSVYEKSLLIVSLILALILVIGWLSLALVLSFAVRVKKGKWWENTLVYLLAKKVLIGFIWKTIVKVVQAIRSFNRMLWESRSLPAKFVIGWFLLSAVEFFFMIAGASSDFSIFALFWVCEKIVLTVFLFVFTVQLRKIRTGCEAIASGDVRYQIDTEKMFFELKNMGEDINHIGEGIGAAVDERMKSERFKTELITNVSHDIKTPLTSIINYVDLLKKEDLENETVKEYLEVLERQSERLKKLIEDLVEASKASSGALSVVQETIDLSVFLTQASGEYQEKMGKNQLTLVLDKPEEPVEVIADGRHLWRVLDNLMNNVCKYALPGSRVYLSLNREGQIVIKNISRYELNISAEELMERFVRGDSSRHTEGHGLGLSISKSLMELMGGTLEIVVDGDLFKVILQMS